MDTFEEGDSIAYRLLGAGEVRTSRVRTEPGQRPQLLVWRKESDGGNGEERGSG